MLKLIIGAKGSGKTKTLIELANTTVENTKGSVVCIEKGKKLIFDIKYQIRLINTDNYDINSASKLYGFISGIIASDHDVTDIFIDAALKISGNNLSEFEILLCDLEKLCSQNNLNITITSSIPFEESTEVIKKYA